MLEKIIRVIKSNISDRSRIKYIKYSEKLPVNDKLIFLESTQGSEFTGHIFALAQELNDEKYAAYEVVVSIRDLNKFKQIQEKYNLYRIKAVKFLDNQYMKYLATAKFIINDTTFWDFFNKRSDQLYYIIWHGTPLKKMGNETDKPLDVSNVQRNFYMADKLFFSNDYTKEIMTRAYGLTNIYDGKIIVGPSPRNSILCSLEDKKTNEELILYMPTWRGTLGEQKDTTKEMVAQLNQLAKSLNQQQKLVVKFHPFQMEKIKREDYPMIHFMPEGIELYAYLKTVDILITDYSSIMFDFVASNKRIILYTYDKEEYFKTRGVYRNVDEFPFEQAQTIEELANVLQTSPALDYAKFKEEFTPYDHSEGTQEILSYMLDEKMSETIKEYSVRNDKETVFLMVGGLWDNGITSALINMFDVIDTNKRNYVLFFYKNLMNSEHFEKLKEFPNNVQFYPISGTPQGDSKDKAMRLLYLKKEGFDSKAINQHMANIYRREYYRLFGGLKNVWIISYTGFEREIAQLIASVPKEVKTGTFLHTDMFKEYELKKSFSMKIMDKAYQSVDKIIPVNRQIGQEMASFYPKTSVQVVNNFLSVERIKQKAKENLALTLETVTVDYAHDAAEEMSQNRVKERLVTELADKELTTFIHIGRYAKEKSHDRLIKAFEENYIENEKTRLILVAPHGPLKNEVLTQIKHSPSKKAITVLGRMDNPYPLLKASNCFVLSSLYEGLGLVVYESLAVGTDVITVNIPATIERLTSENALIVENTQDGLTNGLRQYLAGEFESSPLDFDNIDAQSNLEWEKVFEVSQ